MRTLLTSLASVVLLLAGSCTSPLATLKVGLPGLPPVGAGETQLVFHLSSGAKAAYYDTYNTGVIKYLVVQLHSKNGNGSKFASAAVTGTTVPVNIRGLVAGPWELQVSAYDWDGVTGTKSPWAGSLDDTQPSLLYTAMEEISIQPGTSISVNTLLYKPGDLGNVILVEAVMVNEVDLSQTAPLNVVVGSPSFQVTAKAWNNKTLNVSASDQTFSWYSDNPEVAEVSNSGGDLANVFPKSPGTTKITARSRESEKYGTDKFAQFTLTVEPALVGYWRYDNGASMGYRILKITSGPSGLKVRYLTDLESTSMTPSHHLSDLTSSSSTTWQFNTNQRINLSTGAQEIGTANNFTLQWDGANQLTLNEAPPKVFTRLGTVKPVTSINWPAGNKKTQQMLRSKDLVSPSDATVSSLYFTTLNPAIATTAMMNGGVDFIAQGTVTVTARSVDDPTLVSSQLYNVELAAPMPVGLTAPLATVTDTSIVLSWTYANPGTLPGVNLYRSDNGGTTFLWLTGAPLGADTYTDNSRTAGTEYLYYLVAVGGTSGPDTYTDSLPTKVLSVYTTSGGYPVVVSGPAYNPENQMMDNGNGVSIPTMYNSGPPMGNYGIQGFDNAASPVATVKWLRAGQMVWVVASLPLGGLSAGTLVKKWDQSMPPGMGLLVTGVNKVYNITHEGSGVFKLWGAGSSTGTINFIGGDFNL